MTEVATLLAIIGILGLFVLDQDTKVRTSKALWLAVLWISIAASRPVSVWLQMAPANSAELQLEGSPLDRNVFLALLITGMVVLVARKQRVATILRVNRPLVLFFSYCAISVLWSDYPAVAFKRWIKALGDIVMILIVLTDRDPSAAVKRFLAWPAFILMPLSILFYKYYPTLGRYYSRWEGTQMFGGVTTDKNMLGMGCLILGLGLTWRLFHVFRSRSSEATRRPLIANGIALAMTLWLLIKSNSMTSLCCFVLASGLMAASFHKIGRKRPVMHLLVISVVSVVFVALFLDVGAILLQALGRDPTLTGRTDVWEIVLSLTGNPLIGTGFESFWLGERLEKIWSLHWWRPNEAHNGYLEIFLTLGWIGIGLLVFIILNGYRNILDIFRHNPEAARLRLAYFAVGLAYNFTESAFRTMHLVWIALLLAIVAVPKPRVKRGLRKRAKDESQAWPATGSYAFVTPEPSPR
jgi:exopolysaccharide production protein ExoQ